MSVFGNVAFLGVFWEFWTFGVLGIFDLGIFEYQNVRILGILEFLSLGLLEFSIWYVLNFIMLVFFEFWDFEIPDFGNF